MTRHRSKEEWTALILEAAATEIDENGFASFSMEAVVRRTELSKGGVYRFFKNRQDLARTLFAGCYENNLRYSVQDCLSWDLSVEETLFKVLRFSSFDTESSQLDRLWLRLIPEVLSDPDFKEVRAVLLVRIQEHLHSLVIELAARDELTLSRDFDQAFPDVVAMGVGMMEGFAVQSALGNSMEQLGNLTRQFISGAVMTLFVGATTIKRKKVQR